LKNEHTVKLNTVQIEAAPISVYINMPCAIRTLLKLKKNCFHTSLFSNATRTSQVASFVFVIGDIVSLGTLESCRLLGERAKVKVCNFLGFTLMTGI
jgi:hypothetical protein